MTTLIMLLILSSTFFLVLDNPRFDLREDGVIDNIELHEILLFSNSDRLVIGTSQNDDILTLEEQNQRAGNTDIILFRFSPDYETIWSRYLGGTDRDLVSAAVIDSDDHIFVAGKTWSTDFPKTENSTIGTVDLFFSELAPNGTLVKTTTFGGNGSYFSTETDYENIADIGIKENGEIVLIGDFFSTKFIDNDFTNEFSRTRPKNNYILEFDENGTVNDQSFIAATFADDIKKLKIVENDVYITGCADPEFFSQFNVESDPDYIFDLEKSLELKDIVLIQKQDSGEISFDFFGGSGFECGTDLLITDSSIFLTGTTRSSDFVTGEDSFNGGLSDIFVMELENDRSINWIRNLGGGYIDGANRHIGGSMLSMDQDGNLHLSSISYSRNIETQENNGQFDIINAMYSRNGELQWINFFGGESNEILNDVNILDNTLIVLGYTESQEINGKQVNVSGYRTGLLYEMDITGEIGRVIYV